MTYVKRTNGERRTGTPHILKTWGSQAMTEFENVDSISRRTVTKAMAWAVPAVAVAATVPLAAASPIVTVTDAGDACKLPGNSCSSAGWSKGYLQPLQICNNSTQNLTVEITEPAVLSFNGVPTPFTPVPASFTIPAGDCHRVVLNINTQNNSQNSTISGVLNWTWTAGDGQTGDGQTEIYTAATPPCEGCTV